MSKQTGFYYLDLKTITADLQQEVDRASGPDWRRVQKKAADLSLDAMLALRDERKAPVSARRRLWGR